MQSPPCRVTLLKAGQAAHTGERYNDEADEDELRQRCSYVSPSFRKT